jgi:hypothetical protein
MRYPFAVALILSCAGFVCAQSGKYTITEVKHAAPVAAAPRECLNTFRAFFSYLQYSKPDIVGDEQAQKRWLSQLLRKGLAEKLKSFTSPAENPDYPSNNSFIGAWDPPTTYSIVSSRRYGKRAVIDVLYKWGPKTNYPGDERITSFVFVLEDRAWKLDDIYNIRGEFAPPGSLYQYFVEKR